MGRLRVTLTIEYEIEPRDYGVETMEEAAEEERKALDADLIGTIAMLSDDDEDILSLVEIVK